VQEKLMSKASLSFPGHKMDTKELFKNKIAVASESKSATSLSISGAGDGSRTHDLMITNQV
jgi:hypothetical protein